MGYLLGAMFLVAGLVVLLRPGRSLWFLAVVVGISVIVTGLVEVVVALSEREHLEHWVLIGVLGAVGVVVGVLAIAWPEITVWVLALLIGVRLLIWGVIQLAIAAQIRSLTRRNSPDAADTARPLQSAVGGQKSDSVVIRPASIAARKWAWSSSVWSA